MPFLIFEFMDVLLDLTCKIISIKNVYDAKVICKTIGSNHSFKRYSKKKCEEANQKLSIPRIVGFGTTLHRRTFINSLIKYESSYYLFIWIYSS